jgi:predicted RND superfamily exporter protein
MQVLPFILLGIGIDDMFVLVRSLEEVDELHRGDGLSIEERFRKSLQNGGMSITVTTLTNVTGFLFGSMTAIPAVRWCVVTGMCMSAQLVPL